MIDFDRIDLTIELARKATDGRARTTHLVDAYTQYKHMRSACETDDDRTDLASRHQELLELFGFLQTADPHNPQARSLLPVGPSDEELLWNSVNRVLGRVHDDDAEFVREAILALTTGLSERREARDGG